MPNYTDNTWFEWREMLIRYCLSRQLSLFDAEDIAQESLVRMLASPQLIIHAERWLIRVARNAMIDRFRGSFPEPLDHTWINPEGTGYRSDEMGFDLVEVSDVCTGLVKRDLQICELSFVIGLRDEDTAVVMRIPRETIKKRRQRLAAKMRAQCTR